MQNQDLVNKFNENLSVISEIKAEELERRDELGVDLNFADSIDDFQICINLFRRLGDIDISSLPNSKLTELNNNMKDFIEKIDRVKAYRATEGINTRNSLVQNIVGRYDSWYNSVSPVVAFCLKAGTDFEALQRKANERYTSIQVLYDETSRVIEEKQKELDATLEAVRKAAANVGVTNHTINFSNAAEDYKKEQRFWLWAMCGVLVAIIGFSIWAFMYMKIDKNLSYNYVLITAVMPRFTILFSLFYALHVAGLNYRANSHNLIVNQNKQNALSTFETFVNATNDEQVKNSVLLTTTKSIFSNAQTGYLKNENSSNDDMQIVEVVKDFSKLGKP